MEPAADANSRSEIILGAILVLLPALIFGYSFIHEGHYLGAPVIAEHPLSLQPQQMPVEISINSATYGANCGAKQGNATDDVVLSCNGKSDCTYGINAAHLGDPAPGCAKDFTVSYSCAPVATELRELLRPGSGGPGGVLNLSCGSPARD